MSKKPKKDKLMCSGCEDNFYNGNNQYGIKTCWCYKNAKVILRKQVPLSAIPPWKWSAIWKLSCYHQKGYVFINGNRINYFAKCYIGGIENG